MTTPSPAPYSDKRPRVSVRLDQDFVDTLHAMQAQFPTADGSEATLSDVLRAVLVAGRPLFSAGLWGRIRALAAVAGVKAAVMLLRVVEAGLEALEKRGKK